VIGGLSGAMPPALGWAAVANTVPMEAWLLVLIIFVWTPPHFWALAMYRRDDYVRSGLPMLPVTHGMQYTGLQVWLYSIALAACTLLPYAVGMSGLLYLAAAVVLNAVFLRYGWLVHKRYSDQIARKAFSWSIVYLSLLFAALLVDHYFKF
jgi:protoheme IX farnesyltransferase